MGRTASAARKRPQKRPETTAATTTEGPVSSSDRGKRTSGAKRPAKKRRRQGWDGSSDSSGDSGGDDDDDDDDDDEYDDDDEDDDEDDDGEFRQEPTVDPFAVDEGALFTAQLLLHQFGEHSAHHQTGQPGTHSGPAVWPNWSPAANGQRPTQPQQQPQQQQQQHGPQQQPQQQAQQQPQQQEQQQQPPLPQHQQQISWSQLAEMQQREQLHLQGLQRAYELQKNHLPFQPPTAEQLRQHFSDQQAIASTMSQNMSGHHQVGAPTALLPQPPLHPSLHAGQAFYGLQNGHPDFSVPATRENVLLNMHQDDLPSTAAAPPHPTELLVSASSISKILADETRSPLPPTWRVSQEVRDAMRVCVSEFISFVTSEAADVAVGQRESTRDITSEDILTALQRLEFGEYLAPLSVFLERYRHYNPSRKRGRPRTKTPVQLPVNEQDNS